MFNKKIIFIEWSKYNTRGASFAKVINANMFFIGNANFSNNPLRSFLTYFPKTIENFKILKKEKPDLLIITNTTWVVAFVNLLYSKVTGTDLILDSHSCAFDNSLLKYPLFLSKFFAKHSFLSFVTNNAHVDLLEKWDARVILLNDIPFEDGLKTEKKIKLSNKFNICYVCTFADDEPYEEVLKASEKLDDIHIYVTGKFQKVDIDPNNFKNITFLGFISNEEYKLYINNVNAIMTLTTREDTMQRAGSEAVSVGKPLITSNTKMLKNTFKSGTIFVDNKPDKIKAGIIEMKKNEILFLNAMYEMQKKRMEEFKVKMEIIKKSLEN